MSSGRGTKQGTSNELTPGLQTPEVTPLAPPVPGGAITTEEAPQHCIQEQPDEGPAATSSPSLPNSGAVKDLTEASSRTTTDIPLPLRERRGIQLRSGTILQETAEKTSKVSLENYLSTLLQQVRETDKLTVSNCYVLNKKIEQTREERLAKVQKFKAETEQFKRALLQFEGFSHSLNLENLESNISVSNKSLDTSETSGLRASDFVLSLLSDSLQEASHENLSEIEPISPQTINETIMVDYAKVAKLTAQLVPLFSGAPGPTLSSELQTFIGCCRQTQQCLSDDEQAAFLKILPTRLRGEAYQLLASNNFTSFKEVEDLLNRTYLPRETYQELVNKLITTRQFPLESLTAFTSRVKQLLRLCHEAAELKYGPKATSTVKSQLEDFAINAIKSGVNNPHLCQYLLTLGDETPDTLIQKALDMERLQQTAFNLQPFPTLYGNTTSPTQQVPSPTPYYQTHLPSHTNLPYDHRGQINFTGTQAQYNTSSNPHVLHTSAANSHPRPTPTPQGLDYRRPSNTGNKPQLNITCSFCEKKGHTYTDCLKRKNTPFCSYCKEYNHDIRDCRRTRGPPPRNPDNLRYTHNQRPPNSPQQHNSTHREPRVYNVRLKCDFCGRIGHAVDACHQKKKWEARSQGNDKQSTQNSPARL